MRLYKTMALEDATSLQGYENRQTRAKRTTEEVSRQKRSPAAQDTLEQRGMGELLGMG